jgi:hypothetical protein
MSMLHEPGSWIAVALILALVVWGLVPRREKPREDSAPAVPPSEDPSLARQVGVVTGVLGGSVESAAVTKYALSRLEKPPTAYDIGVAAGIESQQDQSR